MKDQAIDVVGLEQQIHSEWNGLAPDRNLAFHIPPGGEPSLFIELAVVGQMALWHHAKDPPPVDSHRTIVQTSLTTEGRADQYDRVEIAAFGHEVHELPLDLVQQRPLQKQVVDGIARQAELRENHQRGPGLVPLTGEPQGLLQIERRIRDPANGTARSDLTKPCW